MPVTHAFVSAVADGADTTLVRPGDWNADHVTPSILLAQGTITDPAFNLESTVTWNDAADTFTAWKLNITNTNSAAASKLVDLQLGGTTYFDIRKDGYTRVRAVNGTSPALFDVTDTAGNIFFSAGRGSGDVYFRNNLLDISTDGGTFALIGSSGRMLIGNSGGTGSLEFRPDTVSTGDALIARQAVGQMVVTDKFVFKESSTNPSAGDLTSGANAKDRLAIYMKGDKLVFAYNDSGTVTYVTLDLDGSDITWAHGTSAP